MLKAGSIQRTALSRKWAGQSANVLVQTLCAIARRHCRSC